MSETKPHNYLILSYIEEKTYETEPILYELRYPA